MRTPMQGILGFAKLGMERIYEAPKGKLADYFSEVYSSGQRLLVLLNDLLDLSKLETDKERYNFKDWTISNLTVNVLNEFEALCQEKNITIEFHPPDFEDRTSMDKIKIMQVIRNLLSDAINFSPAKSKTAVEITSLQKNLLLSIKDGGIGQPEAELETVFEKFVQSSKTKIGAGGTGLGLAICKQIVLDHHGEIWAGNNPEGGATFYFSLPC
ncbi:MAG: HAMP domain-containing histidine kinase [Proteobacteria bacterium]|nr:HAMP domain-containing histidine kinase [Pseudomonadota bacterium]